MFSAVLTGRVFLFKGSTSCFQAEFLASALRLLSCLLQRMVLSVKYWNTSSELHRDHCVWQRYQLLRISSCKCWYKLFWVHRIYNKDKDTIFLERSGTWRGAGSVYKTQQMKCWRAEKCPNLPSSKFWAERYCWKPLAHCCVDCACRETPVCSDVRPKMFLGSCSLVRRGQDWMCAVQNVPDGLGGVRF